MSKPPKDAIRKYGMAWSPKTFIHPAQIDLALYADDVLREGCGKKALSKADHLRAAIRSCLPEHVFSFNRWSNDIIDQWCDHLICTIWGSSSSGKSGTVAAILLFDLLAAPTVTKVSPLKMHDERAWGSLKKWYSHLPDPLRIGRIMKAPTPALLTVDKEGQVAGVVCISTADGESAEDLKSKIGAHQKRNRFAVDEPQKSSESILSVKANFGASGEYKEIFFGNPDSWFSPLGKHSIPHCLLDETPLTMEQVERDEPQKFLTKQTWRGERGMCIVLDGRDSPAIEDESIEYMAGKDHLEDLVTNFGEDSMQYWTYGIGRMPPDGVIDTLISSQDLRHSGALEKAADLSPPYHTFAGLDPSEGGDGVILTRTRVGTNRNGHTAIAILDSHPIKVKLSKGDVSGQIASQTASKLRQWQIPIRNLGVDTTGNQGAIADAIEREVGQKSLYRCLSSGAASKAKISPSGDRATDHYSDHASEILSNSAALVKQSRVTGITDTIALQMSSRRVHDHNGRLKVEKKDEWKKRHQNKSPDELDSLNVAIDLAIDRKIIKPYIGVSQPRRSTTDPNNPFAPRPGKRQGTLARARRASAIARRR